MQVDLVKYSEDTNNAYVYFREMQFDNQNRLIAATKIVKIVTIDMQLVITRDNRLIKPGAYLENHILNEGLAISWRVYLQPQGLDIYAFVSHPTDRMELAAFDTFIQSEITREFGSGIAES